MAYAKVLTILNNTKQRSLYSSRQGTNVVDAVPPVLRPPNLCARDAHLTLNFITGLVCHTQLTQNYKIFTTVLNLQIVFFS